MKERVRNRSGPPTTTQEFDDSVGTPIIIDEDTGDLYVLVAGVITKVGGANVTGIVWGTFSASAGVVSNRGYIFTTNNLVATLPASPANGDKIFFVSATATLTGCSVARNGKKIMALSEDLTIDNSAHFFFGLVYYDATGDWRIM